MTDWRSTRPVRVLREAAVMALTQRAATAITFMLVAGMSVAVLLTSGRTAAAEAQILASIDSTGSRAITIRAEPKAGLDFSVVERLARIDGVDWVAAFGQATDVTNGATDGDTSVAARTVVTTDLTVLGLASSPVPHSGYASPSAQALLGMPDGAGFLVTSDGAEYPLSGRLTLPKFMSFLDPLVAIPIGPGKSATATEPGDVALVVILVSQPEQVAAIAAASRDLAGARDPSGITISASPEIARLHAIVQGQIGGFGRGLTLMLTAVLATLVGTLMFGLVMIRRKDFGRRRALGATRSLIVALLATNTLLVAAIAAITGTAIALGWLSINHEPLPDPAFVGATIVLTIAAAILGALPPAIVASRRDPLSELRVP